MKASASVFYTRKGTFIVTITERGEQTSNKYDTPMEAKMAVASLLAQGHVVYWAPRASEAAYGEQPLTPFPEKPVAKLAYTTEEM